jgi:hypothetical protein
MDMVDKDKGLQLQPLVILNQSSFYLSGKGLSSPACVNIDVT